VAARAPDMVPPGAYGSPTGPRRSAGIPRPGGGVDRGRSSRDDGPQIKGTATSKTPSQSPFWEWLYVAFGMDD